MLSTAHFLHLFRFITPPRPHVLFCPLCIPQLSLGANLLVEAFWLHLPFKSYHLKLDISSLSCSSIAWDPWDCLPSALVSTGAQFTFPPLEILRLSWCCWCFTCSRNKIHPICTFVSSWLADSCFIVRWQCQKPLHSFSCFSVFILKARYTPGSILSK